MIEAIVVAAVTVSEDLGARGGLSSTEVAVFGHHARWESAEAARVMIDGGAALSGRHDALALSS